MKTEPHLKGQVYLYIDGVSKGNPGASACAGVLYRHGQKQSEFAYPLGLTTNNVAEYCGLILGLLEAKRFENDSVCVYTDSLLLVKQLEGEYQVKDEWLKRLHLVARTLLKLFSRVQVKHISRQANKEADRLANVCLKKAASEEIEGVKIPGEKRSVQTLRLPPRNLFGEESPDSSREGGS